jgi:hypothetical protein
MEANDQFHSPAVLPPAAKSQGKRLGGSQGRCEGCAKKKNVVPLSGIKPQSSCLQSLAVLSYPGSCEEQSCRL